MNELANNQNHYAALRWNLLATVSAFALFGATIGVAEASDSSDHPVVWIELGTQLNRVEGGQDRVQPPFFASIVSAGFDSPEALEKFPLYSIDGSGKISLQPEGSNWVFSVSVRYGRTDSKGYRHEQTNRPPLQSAAFQPSNVRHRYAETSATHNGTHDIVDFMAGKDFGLGVFGKSGTSVLSGGIRIAQFRTRSSLNVYADPDYTNPNVTTLVGPKYFHNFAANTRNAKSFNGIGPEISWDASAPLLGETQSGQITLDWALSGAVLFGRQKSIGFHQTKGKLSTGYISAPGAGKYYNTNHYTRALPHSRSRMVAVPNLGAMAGLSFRYANARVSFGYCSDISFVAIDGGIDTAKKEKEGFSGPFAAVSIGLGG